MKFSVMQFKSLQLFAVCVMLAGCSSSDLSDLRGYINSVKARPAQRIPPLPVFKPYETFEYGAVDFRDPFRMFDYGASSTGSEVADDIAEKHQARNKEALEEYPLDTLKFVGQLQKGDQTWAIVTSPDNIVHRVRVGNYLGTNFGVIIEVLDDKLLIQEDVSDGLGAWIKRDVALGLME